ncbi:hypothetical protein GCM10009799_08500 [Nocardiopsis rhodophaea]|uniref:non-specific serine/threonine protein kinase n=1 Tax=Nocardiopsis rhodophaea TaxID=280238 RepID=A0ABP5DS51_9ACTN
MVTPDQPDPAAPTQRIEPTPAQTTTRLATGHGRTRWVTRILRPGGGASEDAGSADSTRTLEPRTRVLRGARGGVSTSARTSRSRGTGATATFRGTAARADARWRRVFGPVLEWFARLIGRMVVGPASELDYAIPAELRRAYNVRGHIGAGGEAIVYLAEPVDQRTAPGGSPPSAGANVRAGPGGAGGGRRVALKVYRPGHDINRELLDRLRARGTADPHTPAIHGYGYARSSWGEELAWEAQEYFAEGSLRSLLDEAPLPEERARAIVAAVADCLHHWQDSLQHNHTDVKPENLLIRDLDPPVFALTDFGGAVRATMSRVYGGLAITEDYAAPEVVEGRREAPAAWWSLGIMVHELMTGRRPERGESWLTARTTDIDVSGIPDERWRLLARGLLAPVPSARWGHDEVRAWLDGERPEIVAARRHAPLVFADVSHDDPPSLAFDLLDRSDKGEVWLRTHWPSLRTWLDREVNDYTFDRAYLTQLDAHPERVHLAISALAAHYVPGMPPRYRGHEISAEGVLGLAAGERSRHALLREAIELGALDLAARHWCGHPACRADGARRCALLERVQHEVPLIMEQVATTTQRLQSTGVAGITGLAGHEWDTAWATAAELVLDPEAPARHRRLLRDQSWHPSRRSDAPHAPWWREQRRTGLRGRADEVTTNAALVTASLLLPIATAAGSAQRELERANSRARWRGRWQSTTDAVGGGWARVRERLSTARPTGTAGGPTSPAPSPYGPQPWAGPDAQRPKERRRADRAMKQILRSMGAGKCRRFAYPAALLGFLDTLGRVLRGPDGFFPATETVRSLYEPLVVFGSDDRSNIVVSLAKNVVGLLPGGVADQWWLPAVLGAILVLLGRAAANNRRKARTQLGAFRLAVVGSVLMAMVLLSTGFVMLGAGVLIPLDALLAG